MVSADGKLAYITFVGSMISDSAVISIVPTNPTSFKVETIKTIINIGPAVGLEVLPADEPNYPVQIIHCGPLGVHALQRVAVFNEEVKFEQPGLSDVWSIKVPYGVNPLNLQLLLRPATLSLQQTIERIAT